MLTELFENFEEIMEEMVATNLVVQECDVGNESEKRCVKDETKKEIQQSEDTPPTGSESGSDYTDLDEDTRNGSHLFDTPGEFMVGGTQQERASSSGSSTVSRNRQQDPAKRCLEIIRKLNHVMYNNV